MVDGTSYTEEEILNGWAAHFERLGMPAEAEGPFNDEVCAQVNKELEEMLHMTRVGPDTA